MELLGRLLLALAVAYGIAFLLLVPLRRQNRITRAASWLLPPAVLWTPLLIPEEAVGHRTVAMFLAAELFFRTADVLRRCRTERIEARAYLAHLIPFPVLLVDFAARQRRLATRVPIGPEVSRVLLGTSGFAAAILLTASLSQNSVLQSSHLLDHIVKLGIFIVAVESASTALWGLERLAGFDTRPIVRNMLLSLTPAEFWSRRYNTRVHEWLDRNVFRPSGGRHAPVRGVILVFLASGLVHELAFGIATSHFDGYQFAFFALQAPAVIASAPLSRFARRNLAAEAAVRILTVVWFAGTSLLFFRGVERIFPFVYASDPWLQ